MIAAAMMLLAAVSTVGKTTEAEESSVQSMLNEESPDVFLAKATLQQYLSRVVRKDWDGTRRLTHPKALSAIAALKKRTGAERHNLAPWANRQAQLKTFRFGQAKELSPRESVYAVEVAKEIGQSAPLAIVATRETLRRGLAEAVARATEREYEEQDWLRNTADFKEGTKAMGERRLPNFQAR